MSEPRRIISLSCWGDDPKYSHGVLENARLAPVIYPGWQMRVYHSKSIPVNIIAELKELGVETIQWQTTKPIEWSGLFWRFLPAFERGLDAFVVRDADSRINVREKAAVDDWIETGYPFHTMRDHYEHTTVPVMGGMWGHRGPITDFQIEFDAWSYRSRLEKGSDQLFLAEKIWPKMRERCIVHDLYYNGLLRKADGEMIEPHRATRIVYKPWSFGQPRNDHMPPEEVMLDDGRRFKRSDFYEYHPSRFGEHLARPFPHHAPLDGGLGHVGEIVT